MAIRHNSPDNHPQWGNYHHYSFIVKNNKIIQWATNYRGTAVHQLGYKDYQKIHSEQMAFKRARKLLGKELGEFELLNLRLNKTNELKKSYPCLCCLNWLQDSGCIRIFYSHENGVSQIIV